MDNPLDTTQPYPHELTFLVRLHRCNRPATPQLQGRLHHLPSGKHVDFGDFEGLQAALQACVERILTTPSS
jgi:hypothetical protein